MIAVAPQTALAADRAALWLAAVAAQAAAESGLALEAIALSQICRLLSSRHVSVLETAETAIASAVPEPRFAAANLLTALLAAKACVRQGNPAAPAAADYLDLLGELPRTTWQGANGVLVRLALGADAPSSSATPATPVLQDLADGSLTCLRRYLDAVETASAFGTRSAALPPPHAILMEGAALAALRSYDLPLGLRLLRARHYAKPGRSAGATACMAFVRNAQNADGSFGDFDTALARLSAAGDRAGALAIKLPVTSQALWTLAELENPAFRLVRHIFSGRVARSCVAEPAHAVAAPD